MVDKYAGATATALLQGDVSHQVTTIMPCKLYLVNAHLSGFAQHGEPNSLMPIGQELLHHLQCA